MVEQGAHPAHHVVVEALGVDLDQRRAREELPRQQLVEAPDGHGEHLLDRALALVDERAAARSVVAEELQVDGRILAVLIPGAIVGIGLAWWLAAYISDAAVRVFIGVTTIGYVLHTWIGPARVARKAGNANAGAGVFLGAVSGFTSKRCQAGAPPYQMYALSQHLTKMTYRRHHRRCSSAAHQLGQGRALSRARPVLHEGVSLTSLALLPLAIADQPGRLLGRAASPRQAAVLPRHDDHLCS